MSQRVVLVTGSTDGIGRQTARQLAAGGMKVIVHGRSKANVDATVSRLREELPGGTFESVSFDLATVAGVRRGVDQLLSIAPRLHVLVNNAGIIAAERAITEDGIEATFAVNYLGAFLLTELLRPRLVESAAGGPPSRVICVASVAHTRGRIHFDDLTLSSAWTSYAAYAQSKLANVMHAISLAERADAKELVAYAVHPGVVNTKLLRQGFGPVQGLTPEAGARTAVMLAGAEVGDHPSGSYVSEGVVVQPASTARDPQTRARLWDVSVTLAKL